MAQRRTFGLSFSRLIRWSGRFLVPFTMVALAVFLALGLSLFFLSRLPLELFLSPVMLGIIPVLVILAFFLPVLLILCYASSRLIRYEVTDLGIVQHLGPFRSAVDWLEMEGIEEVSPLRLHQWRIKVLKQDRVLMLYLGFLSEPEAFLEKVSAEAPAGSSLRDWLDRRDRIREGLESLSA